MVSKEVDLLMERLKLYSWIILVPLIFGLVFGRLVGISLGYGLDKLSSDSGVSKSLLSVERQTNSSNEKDHGYDEFLAANPFRISSQKTASADETPKTVVEEKKPEPPSTLDNLILRGTLPNVGAWIEDKGSLKLLLIGKTYEKYKMTSVNYREAVFRKGREKVIKRIVYGPVPKNDGKKEEPKPKVAQTPKPAEPPAQGNIVAAAPDGKDGQVPSEILNQLVQNPFDELKRIRMRPNDKFGGLEVQWIQNESILKRLGVQKGDVIKSVNGIPFTNMGDIANSINSLMNSERFDVEVNRGGNPTALRYVVR